MALPDADDLLSAFPWRAMLPAIMSISFLASCNSCIWPFARSRRVFVFELLDAARIEFDKPIRPRRLATGDLHVLNRAVFRDNLRRVEKVKGFRSALVNLVLRADHLPHKAVSLVLAIDVCAAEDQLAIALAVVVSVRRLARREYPALGVFRPEPLARALDPYLADADATALRVRPYAEFRPVVICVGRGNAANRRLESVGCIGILAKRLVNVLPPDHADVARIREICLA